MNRDISRRAAWVLNNKPLSGNKWLEFVESIEKAVKFEDLDDWMQQFILMGEAEFGTNPAHQENNAEVKGGLKWA